MTRLPPAILAKKSGVPILAGSDEAIASVEEARQIAEKLGYPVILKAAHGGGGRGMRVVNNADELAPNLEQAQREAAAAFGSARRLRREVHPPRTAHRGAIARRPARQPGPSVRARLLGAATASEGRRNRARTEPRRPTCDDRSATRRSAIGRAVDYENAGTVEFLVDADTGEFYFIEVNPRIQVEHTVTEEVTGDRHRASAQILIAQGRPLSDPEIGLSAQEDSPHQRLCDPVPRDDRRSRQPLSARLRADHALPLGQRHGHSARCRHRLFRRGGHAVLRLAAGQGDVPAAGRFVDAARRMERCLQEFRVRGVKTNIPFLINLVTHPDISGRRMHDAVHR